MTFQKGDKVKVCSEWLPDKLRGKCRATIKGFQNNGEVFAILRWKHEDNYGSLFPLHELKAIK